MLEHRPRRQHKARPPRTAHQLDRHDAVAAELEEVVVDADPLDPQHLRKQRAQQFLLRRPRTAMRARPRIRPAQAARAGRACRSESAASDPEQRSPTAPGAPEAPPPAPHAAQTAQPQTPPPKPRTQPAAHWRPRRRRHPAARSPPPAPRQPAAVSAASISPGSIRRPRSLICASARPKNSSTPSERQRARSPVRYIRLPAAPYGSATNRSAVRPARPRYPRARPAPEM